MCGTLFIKRISVGYPVMTSDDSNHVTYVLILGDAGIGKTSLARTITNGVFPSASSLPLTSPHPPAEYKTSRQTSILAGDTYHVMHFHDAAEDLAVETRIDVVYLCFDVSCRATFDAIQTKWLPKAKSINKAKKKKLQYILIGLKSDQVPSASVSSDGQGHTEPVPASSAIDLANQMQATAYVEVSSLKHLGIEKVKEQTVFCASSKDTTAASNNNSLFRKHKDKCLVM